MVRLSSGVISGFPQDFPHATHRVHEVFHEMFDPACATAKVPLQTGTHYSPPQSRPIAHRIIGLRDTQHALLDEVQRPLDREPPGAGFATWPGTSFRRRMGFLPIEA